MILYLSEFFYLFIYFTYISDIYQKYIYQKFIRLYFWECFVLRFINMIVLSLSYIVYRKEQSKTRGKSREKIGREYDQISQIIKKKFYL